MEVPDRQFVIAALRKVEPEDIRTHLVVVDGRRFPVKQAYAIVSGDDRLDFNTVKARRFFGRLGFELQRVSRVHGVR